MSYPADGHVDPGGPSISRTVTTQEGTLELRKLSVGPMDNNVYVLEHEGEALLVDAANDAARILREVEGLDVRAIMTTHGHGDHWQALEEVARATGAEVLLHEADQPMVPRQADRHVADGQVLQVGPVPVRLIHTPGHTPGSTCLVVGDVLLSGDTLFPGGPGNTFGNADAFAQIMDSLNRRLFGELGDDVRILPGHGDDSTIGAERPHLEEWRERGW